MDNPKKETSTQNIDKVSKRNNESRPDDLNTALIDVTNGKDAANSQTNSTCNSQTTTRNLSTKPANSNIIDKENAECSPHQFNGPKIDVSKLSGIKKKRASFFTKQFSSFDGSSHIERFHSAIASAASVFSSSVGSSQSQSNSSNENSSKQVDHLSSSKSRETTPSLSTSVKTSDEPSLERISIFLPKTSEEISENRGDNDAVSNNVAALLSPSTGAKSKSFKKGKKHKKDSKKGSFLRRSGSHSPSIRRSPTKAVAETGSSCINQSVSDRSGPSSGNTTPSPRSFRRTVKTPETLTDNSVIRTSANTLTVPTSSSAYGAIPRTTINNQSHEIPSSENDPPRRCFCGHYTEVRIEKIMFFIYSKIINLVIEKYPFIHAICFELAANGKGQ